MDNDALSSIEQQISVLTPELRGELIHNLCSDEEPFYFLSREKLKDIIRVPSIIKERRFKRRKAPKYGVPGSKAFTLAQVDQFFSGFPPHLWRYKVLFLTQAFLGLRIGETTKIRLCDIDFKNKQIAIHSEKKRYNAIDFLFLHEKLEGLLMIYIGEYEKEIEEHEGYLFFADTSRGKTKHISTGQARKIFCFVRERTDLNQKYGVREGISGVKFPAGELYRYTTHSLRHSFGKFLTKRGIPIEIAKHLLRHQDIKSTQIYYVPDKEDVDETMRKLFIQQKT